VFDRTICAPVSRSWAGVTVLTLARVPTGMKRGVLTLPWGVWKLPARALVQVQVASIAKEKLLNCLKPFNVVIIHLGIPASRQHIRHHGF
jgi:hypothetical protein